MGPETPVRRREIRHANTATHFRRRTSTSWDPKSFQSASPKHAKMEWEGASEREREGQNASGEGKGVSEKIGDKSRTASLFKFPGAWARNLIKPTNEMLKIAREMMNANKIGRRCWVCIVPVGRCARLNFVSRTRSFCFGDIPNNSNIRSTCYFTYVPNVYWNVGSKRISLADMFLAYNKVKPNLYTNFCNVGYVVL